MDKLFDVLMTDWVIPNDTTAAAVQRVEVGTLERAVKLSNKDAKLTKEHLRPLQVSMSVPVRLLSMTAHNEF